MTHRRVVLASLCAALGSLAAVSPALAWTPYTHLHTANQARQSMLDDVARILQKEIPTVPLHQPLLVWAARRGVNVEQYPDDFFPLRLVRVGSGE